MLRISTYETADVTTMILEGRVIGPWVDEVRRAYHDTLAARRPVVLDLAGVTFVDGAGIVLLREIASRQTALANCTPFVSAQLKG